MGRFWILKIINSLAARQLMLERLENSGALPVLELLAERGAKPYVCAGAVRDVYFLLERGGNQSEARDIDVVTLGFAAESLDELAVSLGATPNRYGGYSYKDSHRPAVDFWNAADTCGVVAWGVPATLRNVLRSFVFNLNAIAFEFTSGKFFDLGSVASIRKRKLGFVEDVLIHDEDIFAAKALISAARFSLAPTNAVTALVASHAVHSSIVHELCKARKLLDPSTTIESLGQNFFSYSRHSPRVWASKKLI